MKHWVASVDVVLLFSFCLNWTPCWTPAPSLQSPQEGCLHPNNTTHHHKVLFQLQAREVRTLQWRVQIHMFVLAKCYQTPQQLTEAQTCSTLQDCMFYLINSYNDLTYMSHILFCLSICKYASTADWGQLKSSVWHGVDSTLRISLLRKTFPDMHDIKHAEFLKWSRLKLRKKINQYSTSLVQTLFTNQYLWVVHT